MPHTYNLRDRGRIPTSRCPNCGENEKPYTSHEKPHVNLRKMTEKGPPQSDKTDKVSFPEREDELGELERKFEERLALREIEFDERRREIELRFAEKEKRLLDFIEHRERSLALQEAEHERRLRDDTNDKYDFRVKRPFTPYDGESQGKDEDHLFPAPKSSCKHAPPAPQRQVREGFRVESKSAPIFRGMTMFTNL